MRIVTKTKLRFNRFENRFVRLLKGQLMPNGRQYQRERFYSKPDEELRRIPEETWIMNYEGIIKSFLIPRHK